MVAYSNIANKPGSKKQATHAFGLLIQEIQAIGKKHNPFMKLDFKQKNQLFPETLISFSKISIALLLITVPGPKIKDTPAL